jgi:hypothetical protein
MKTVKYILRSYGNYNKLCSYAPGSPPEDYSGASDIEIDGSFDYLGDCFIALYKNSGSLFIAVNEESHDISSVALTHTKQGLNSKLIVDISGRDNIACEYKPEASLKTWLIDFLSFNDYGKSDESCDYGLFLSNILNDVERQKVLLGLE